MANPLLALQVEGLDIQPALNALSQGLEQRYKNQAAEQEQNVLTQILAPALQPGGDMAASAAAALAANKPDLALKLHELSREEKKEFATKVGQYATLADTPQKWEAVRSRLTEITGKDPGDFDTGRVLLLAETSDIDTFLDALEREQDNTRADETLKIQQERLRMEQEAAAGGGKPPTNYQWGSDGVAVPIPGGPADPAVIAQTAAARRPGAGATPNATIAKEIFEADEAVQAGENVVASLAKALELNEKAYSGPAAGARGYAASIVGVDAGEATEELKNIIQSQALESLKATFGGMPTEGERKVLMEVQGSVNQAPAVRKGIYERAQAAAKRRIEFNRKKAAELRAGTYLSSDASSPDDLVAAPAADGPPEGVAADLWEEMTPEERSAWEN